jgi:hypothetical protein
VLTRIPPVNDSATGATNYSIGFKTIAQREQGERESVCVWYNILSSTGGQEYGVEFVRAEVGDGDTGAEDGQRL